MRPGAPRRRILCGALYALRRAVHRHRIKVRELAGGEFDHRRPELIGPDGCNDGALKAHRRAAALHDSDMLPGLQMQYHLPLPQQLVHHVAG